MQLHQNFWHESVQGMHILRKKTGRHPKLAFQAFRNWVKKRFSRKQGQIPMTEPAPHAPVPEYEFSPMTYQNPFIPYFQDILEQLLEQKHIARRRLELVVIDAEENRDDDGEDMEHILYEAVRQLNYLLVVTDRPQRYAHFAQQVYEENGLIIQTSPKPAHRGIRGNMVLDFERSGGIRAETIRRGTVYVPFYKRPWEIGENLDILVPVGYNTLVVGGILSAYFEDSRPIDEKFLKDRKPDRLEREFRKG